MLAVARAVSRFDWGWERFLHGMCVFFHGLMAVTLALAPLDQIYNAGTRPVFDLASRYVWAVAFAVVAVSLVLLRDTRRRGLLAAAWLLTVFLGGMWLTAFALAVSRGVGSAIGVVVWMTIYGIFAVVGYRSLGKR